MRNGLIDKKILFMLLSKSVIYIIVLFIVNFKFLIFDFKNEKNFGVNLYRYINFVVWDYRILNINSL